MITPPDLPRQAPRKTSGLAIASLVFGIISIMGGLLLIFPPILAIVFGILALVKIQKDPSLQGKGLAIAGLITTGAGIPVLGLLAAMAIPAFKKVEENSRQKTISNDARMIGAAAQMVFLDNPNQPIVITIAPQTGKVSGPLAPYVPQLSPGTIAVDNVLENSSDGFSLSNPKLKAGAVYHFDAQGKSLAK